MTPIILSQEIASVPSAPQSSVDHRNEILALCAPITEVRTHEQLEAAVKVLASLAGIAKETELARKTVKEPVLALGKAIDKVAADFVASVEKERNRITGLANHYQQLQLREKEERERKARADAEKAQREAEEAKRQIEAATNEDDKLDAQLRAESASLAAQNAQQQLSIPTNTPRGMTTRVRYDFEMIDWKAAYDHHPAAYLWEWIKDEECLNFNRKNFLKEINTFDTQQGWIPKDGMDSHVVYGIRIFRDVSVSVRG